MPDLWITCNQINADTPVILVARSGESKHIPLLIFIKGSNHVLYSDFCMVDSSPSGHLLSRDFRFWRDNDVAQAWEPASQITLWPSEHYSCVVEIALQQNETFDSIRTQVQNNREPQINTTKEMADLSGTSLTTKSHFLAPTADSYVSFTCKIALMELNTSHQPLGLSAAPINYLVRWSHQYWTCLWAFMALNNSSERGDDEIGSKADMKRTGQYALL